MGRCNFYYSSDAERQKIYQNFSDKYNSTILQSITTILQLIFLTYYMIHLIVSSPEVPSLRQMATFQINFHNIVLWVT